MADNLTKPYVFANTFCNSGDKTGTIPVVDTNTNSASLAKGFPVITSTAIGEGGIPPKRTDFNGILNALSQYCFFLQNGGEFEYDSAVATAIGGYSNKAILRFTDTNNGAIYKIKSLINNNNNVPTTSNIRVSASQSGTFYWELANNEIPVGTILPFASAVIPTGWLLCKGDEVAKSTYSFLYALIGDTYGIASDNTKFKLPDFRNKTFWGGDTTNAGTEKSAGLPNIKGKDGMGWIGAYNGVTNNANYREGALKGEQYYISSGYVNEGRNQIATGQEIGIGFDASQYNSIYKDDVNTVQPPAIQTPFIIKF